MSESLYRFRYDEYGNTREIIVYASGASARSCNYINKGTAFTTDERKKLILNGTIPPGIRDLKGQVANARIQVMEKSDDIERYIFFRSLFNRNVTLAHALIRSDIETFIKIIYTPTIGLAVRRYSSMFRQANGLHFYPGNIDDAEDILRRFAHRDIRVAVVTDNHGILGIGDQGAGGIAVCLGKLMLYTQGAGIAPWHCLPVSLDVGTNNKTLLDDPYYLGWRHNRLEGEEYLSFVGKFVRAFRNVFPHALCQWEDFSPKNAFSIRDAFQDEIISFNDDIQGTGAVALSAILSAMKIKKEKLENQVFLIHGGGSSGIGIAEQLKRSLEQRGLTEKEACGKIYIVDSAGLLRKDTDVAYYKQKFVKNGESGDWVDSINPVNISEVIRKAGVTVLIGTEEEFLFDNVIMNELKNNTDRPVILSLFQHVSAPSTFSQNLERWSEQGALVATGTPCDSLKALEDAYGVTQCNNAVIFPGVCLGVLASGAREVLPEFFDVAAETVSSQVSDAELQKGHLMPSIRNIRKIAKEVAFAVAVCAVENKISRPCVYSDFAHNDEEARLKRLIDNMRWRPEYLPFIPM